MSVRFCPLCGIPMTNGISLGICAMDYRGDDSNQSADTPGLIVDYVSRREQPRVYLLIRSFDFLAHA
jgi:hypothetical protein